jgi:hypothetical protein
MVARIESYLDLVLDGYSESHLVEGNVELHAVVKSCNNVKIIVISANPRDSVFHVIGSNGPVEHSMQIFADLVTVSKTLHTPIVISRVHNHKTANIMQAYDGWGFITHKPTNPQMEQGLLSLGYRCVTRDNDFAFVPKDIVGIEFVNWEKLE